MATAFEMVFHSPVLLAVHLELLPFRSQRQQLRTSWHPWLSLCCWCAWWCSWTIPLQAVRHWVRLSLCLSLLSCAPTGRRQVRDFLKQSYTSIILAALLRQLVLGWKSEPRCMSKLVAATGWASLNYTKSWNTLFKHFAHCCNMLWHFSSLL